MIGALNTLHTRDDPSYHIWGVSYGIGHTIPDGVSTVSIALNWVTKQPKFRRNGFPSWSPLSGGSSRIEMAETLLYRCMSGFGLKVSLNDKFEVVNALVLPTANLHTCTLESQISLISAFAFEIQAKS